LFPFRSLVLPSDLLHRALAHALRPATAGPPTENAVRKPSFARRRIRRQPRRTPPPHSMGRVAAPHVAVTRNAPWAGNGCAIPRKAMSRNRLRTGREISYAGERRRIDCRLQCGSCVLRRRIPALPRIIDNASAVAWALLERRAAGDFDLGVRRPSSRGGLVSGPQGRRSSSPPVIISQGHTYLVK
jgi:hypothetical protein